MEDRELLGQAVRALASVCDGAHERDLAGFNKIDAGFGHKMASIPAEEWTARQTRAVWRMLAKYRGQLAQMGIDYDAIPKPPEPREEGRRNSAWVAGDKFIISFRYDPDLVYAVKRIPGARFAPETKTWSVPQALNVVEPLVDFLMNYDFEFPPALMERLAKIAEEAQHRLEASRAASAEIEVPGLGGELRPFQRAGVAYALQARRCFIGDEMGLGKTIQALATIQAANAYPALIICPASLKLNWAREARKWLPGRTVIVLNGRNGAIAADVVILNYDILGKWLEALKAVKWQALICDESHYVKNPKAQRTEHVKEIAAEVPVRLLLTGTPLLNRPAELISQLEVLGRLGDFGGWYKFVTRYCGGHRGRWGWDISGATNLEELNQRLRMTCYIRREKADVLKELPAKQRAVVPVEIDNRDEYRRAERDVVAWLRAKAAEDEAFLAEIAHLPEPERRKRQMERMMSAEEKARRAEELVKIEALKQIAARGKLAAVKEWARDFLESGEKLVLFAAHVEVQKALLSEFPGAAHILGEDDTETRQANVDRFQNDPECRLIVCSLQAAGVGVTLTAASNVAFVELGWTPAIHDQAEDRVHRIGQESQVTAWYLLAEDTIDMEIADLIEKKRAVVNAATVGAAAAEESVLGDVIARLMQKEAH